MNIFGTIILWLLLFSFGCFLAAAIGLSVAGGLIMAITGATLGAGAPHLKDLI